MADEDITPETTADEQAQDEQPAEAAAAAAQPSAPAGQFPQHTGFVNNTLVVIATGPDGREFIINSPLDWAEMVKQYETES